jgi:hypothetical protein
LEQELRKEREKNALLMEKQTYPTQDHTISVPPESSQVQLARGSVLNLALMYVQEKTLYPLV